jgi:hypothetical protein
MPKPLVILSLRRRVRVSIVGKIAGAMQVPAETAVIWDLHSTGAPARLVAYLDGYCQLARTTCYSWGRKPSRVST